jgi:zona occludens toxin (predicted ATPase)
MNISVSIRREDYDWLYEYGHRTGNHTIPKIISYLRDKIEHGYQQQLYSALGQPKRFAKALKRNKKHR